MDAMHKPVAFVSLQTASKRGETREFLVHSQHTNLTLRYFRFVFVAFGWHSIATSSKRAVCLLVYETPLLRSTEDRLRTRNRAYEQGAFKHDALPCLVDCTGRCIYRFHSHPFYGTRMDMLLPCLDSSPASRLSSSLTEGQELSHCCPL